MNTCVLLRHESIVATPDQSLSLSLLRDKQRVSLGELLTVVTPNFNCQLDMKMDLYAKHIVDIGLSLTEFHKFW